MIYVSFLVAGVGIGYGVHSGNVAVLVIAVWVLLATLILAFFAGVSRANERIDRYIAEQFEADAQEGFGGQVHYKVFDDGYALPTAIRISQGRP